MVPNPTTSPDTITLFNTATFSVTIGSLQIDDGDGATPFENQATAQAPWLPLGAVSADEAQGVQGYQ
jgi:hypothetical protein